MTDYSIFSGPGSAALSGPGSSIAFGSDIVVGTQFKVTAGGLYLKGYKYWVADAGGNHASQKFALQQPDPDTTTWSLISGGTVTAGSAFTAGQWNTVLLAAPVPLAASVTYTACTGFTGNFNETKNFFGTGGTAAGGLTNGPLNMYSDIAGNGGTDPPDYGHVQGAFSLAGNDPAAHPPGSSDSSFNPWIDVIITDQAPAGASYRTWPNLAEPTAAESTDVTGYTLGMEFSLTVPCTLDRIWHWSPPGCVTLPTRCLLWNVAGTSAVPGTDNTSPSWLLPGGGAATAGGGWVYCDYSGSGVTLSSGVNYKVSTFHVTGSGQFWFGVTAGYWSTGPGGAGFTYGPLAVPDNAGASPGQNSWNPVSFGYPNTSSSPENDWVDVEVTPAGSARTATASLTVTPSFSAARTRGHSRTGSLTVTPSASAARTRGHSRTGSLTVTPSSSAARMHGHSRTAAFTAAPSFTTARVYGHGRAAALTVTPVLSAARTAAHLRTASLTVAAVAAAAARNSGGAAVVFSCGIPGFRWAYGTPYPS